MKKQAWKTSFAKLLLAFIAVLSVTLITPSVADAAAVPALNKTTSSILVGGKYSFSIKNKVAGSTYSWSTSNKSIAKVDKKGVVTGVKKGTAVVSVKIKTLRKTYTSKAKVTVIQGAKAVAISNKITALNAGQSYALSTTVAPSTSNDYVTWASSDSTIAKLDKNGKLTALKPGTVTITASTQSKVKDTMNLTVVDADGTVTSQAELNALLGTAATQVTIKTDAAVTLTIAKGDYSKQSLVVIAPNADITNYGTFKAIEIKSIKSDTWTEGTTGNSITVVDSDARIVIAPGASVSIEATTEGATLKIVNNGEVKELKLDKKAEIQIAGTSTQAIPLKIDVPGIKIVSSAPLDLTCTAKVELVLKPGAEKTTIVAASDATVPTIAGDVTINVKVGTGSDAVTKTIVGTPIPDATAATPSGSSNSGTPITNVTFYDTVLDNITALSYGGHDVPLLSAIKNLLKSDNAQADWNTSLMNGTNTIGGQTVTITPSSQANTKHVAISGGTFSGKSYDVTVTTAGAQTAIIIADGTKSITFTKNAGENTFSINTAYTFADFENSSNASSFFATLPDMSVTYKGTAYTVSIPDYNVIIGYINHSVSKVADWTGITTAQTKTYFGQNVTVAPTSDPNTKTVTMATSHKSYTVRIAGSSADGTISITNGAGVKVSFTKGANAIGVTLN